MILFFNYRIGTEHEKFGFELSTLHPMKYEQIAELLNGIAERFDWEKVMEGDNIIGLKQVNVDMHYADDVVVIFLLVSFFVYAYHDINAAPGLFLRT